MAGLFTGCSPKEQTKIFTYRFANADECYELLAGNDDYYNNLNQMDLDFRLQKKGGTLEELLTLTKDQTREFTQEEKDSINNAMDIIEKTCQERGYALPPISDIVFCKTTMEEECNAGAYTHGTQVYIGESVLAYGISSDQRKQEYFNAIITHELFHCLTRNHPEFRSSMYKLLNFTVTNKDYNFPQSTKDKIISNPDVEHLDSYATFDIHGEQMDCVVIFTTDTPFEKPGDSFFTNGFTGLVPVDHLDTIYKSDDASNFWDVFGKNTYYVIDPEEAMAENFAFTIIYGLDGREYLTPELIQAIDARLKAGFEAK
jgi:hypothetical protein